MKSLPVFRCLHPAFPVDVGLGGDATHAAGAGTGPETQSGSCGRLEKSEKTEKHASIDSVSQLLTKNGGLLFVVENIISCSARFTRAWEVWVTAAAWWRP